MAAAPWPFFKWGTDQRYHLENFRAALDAPGEWFLDRDGTLSYIPLPGEDLTKARVIAPVTDQLVRFTGGAGGLVEHITLKGLTFEYAGYTLPPIQSYIYGGWGLYTDEGSTGITLENNLVYNTKTGGFHQHYGRENIIRNNIFAFASQHQLQRTRKEAHLSFTFSNNIVLWSAGKLLEGEWQDPEVVMSRNLYWRINAAPIDFAGKSFKQWQQSAKDEGSMIADPEFGDAEKRDFRLNRDNARLAEIGFKPFDFSQAGVYGETCWKQLAVARTYPAPKIPPPP